MTPATIAMPGLIVTTASAPINDPKTEAAYHAAYAHRSTYPERIATIGIIQRSRPIRYDPFVLRLAVHALGGSDLHRAFRGKPQRERRGGVRVARTVNARTAHSLIRLDAP